MKGFTLTISAIAILFIFPSQQVLSLDIPPGSPAVNSESSTELQHKKEVEIEKSEMDFLLAPVKNQVDLIKYLAITPVEKTPLGALPEIEREMFINSLVFTKGGLASFDYSVLSYGPTATEVYSILALFGKQSTTPFLPGLTIALESDSSIMEAKKIIDPDPILFDHKCIYNPPIGTFFCGYRFRKICFPLDCY